MEQELEHHGTGEHIAHQSERGQGPTSGDARWSSVPARRLITLSAFLALAISMLFVISPSPASANSCSIANNSPGFGKRRVCKFDGVHRVGASVRGSITWHFADNMKQGDYGLTLTDTAADGKCAWVKITTPGGTVWLPDHKACGNGTSQGFGRTFNASPPSYDSGWFRFYLCTGQTDNCTKFWEQQIQQPNP